MGSLSVRIFFPQIMRRALSTLLALFAAAFLFSCIPASAQPKAEGGKKVTVTGKHEGDQKCQDVTVFIGNVKDTDITRITVTVTNKGGKKDVWDMVRIRDESKGTGMFKANGCTVFIQNKDGKTIDPNDTVEITIETGKTIDKKNIGKIQPRYGKPGDRRPDGEIEKPDIKVEKGTDKKPGGCRHADGTTTISLTVDSDEAGVVTVQDVEWSIADGSTPTDSLTDYAVPLPSMGIFGFAAPCGDPLTLVSFDIPDGMEGFWVYVRARVFVNGEDEGVVIWAQELIPDDPTVITDPIGLDPLPIALPPVPVTDPLLPPK